LGGLLLIAVGASLIPLSSAANISNVNAIKFDQSIRSVNANNGVATYYALAKDLNATYK